MVSGTMLSSLTARFDVIPLFLTAALATWRLAVVALNPPGLRETQRRGDAKPQRVRLRNLIVALLCVLAPLRPSVACLPQTGRQRS